jgi:hypothetical protein
MKIIFTILLSVVLIAKSFFFFGWEMWYKMDQNRIARENCENKVRPKLKCNGKCYLAKQLKKLEAEEQKNSSNHKRNPFSIKTEIQFVSEFRLKAHFTEINFKESTKSAFNYNESKTIDCTHSIFHPPCFA